MTKSHLKRINAPKTWPVKRKTSAWITRPNPGPHALDSSISLNTMLKELLKYTDTSRETKRLLNEGNILVNGIPRKDLKFPLGVMDTLQLSKEEAFRLLYNKRGKLTLQKIKPEEASIIPRKIIGKKLLKKGRLQLNLNDGTNILVEKGDYKLGDTLILEKSKIKSHLKFDKGSFVYLTKGKHIGLLATLQEIKAKPLQKTLITIKTEKTTFDTLKDYAIVIGKEKPMITIGK